MVEYTNLEDALIKQLVKANIGKKTHRPRWHIIEDTMNSYLNDQRVDILGRLRNEPYTISMLRNRYQRMKKVYVTKNGRKPNRCLRCGEIYRGHTCKNPRLWKVKIKYPTYSEEEKKHEKEKEYEEEDEDTEDEIDIVNKECSTKCDAKIEALSFTNDLHSQFTIIDQMSKDNRNLLDPGFDSLDIKACFIQMLECNSVLLYPVSYVSSDIL